jgi:L-aminopeptidase/D-esterase-like protein
VLSHCQDELAALEPGEGSDRRLAARLRGSLADLLRAAAAPPRTPGAKVREVAEGVLRAVRASCGLLYAAAARLCVGDIEQGTVGGGAT